MSLGIRLGISQSLPDNVLPPPHRRWSRELAVTTFRTGTQSRRSSPRLVGQQAHRALRRRQCRPSTHNPTQPAPARGWWLKKARSTVQNRGLRGTGSVNYARTAQGMQATDAVHQQGCRKVTNLSQLPQKTGDCGGQQKRFASHFSQLWEHPECRLYQRWEFADRRLAATYRHAASVSPLCDHHDPIIATGRAGTPNRES